MLDQQQNIKMGLQLAKEFTQSLTHCVNTRNHEDQGSYREAWTWEN